MTGYGRSGGVFMIIGVPREVRPSEYRVGLTPAGTDALLRRGHTVYVERGAGAGAGFADKEYQAGGARVAFSPGGGGGGSRVRGQRVPGRRSAVGFLPRGGVAARPGGREGGAADGRRARVLPGADSRLVPPSGRGLAGPACRHAGRDDGHHLRDDPGG